MTYLFVGMMIGFIVGILLGVFGATAYSAKQENHKLEKLLREAKIKC